MKIKILYEDKNLMVINKPVGLSIHADGKNNEKTLVDWILEKYPGIKRVGESMEVEYKNKKIKIPRPGIVHRLDKETSGVLLIAKNQKTFSSLKKQFQDHQIKKVYRAFVYGYISDPKASLATSKRGVIKASIGRSPKDIRTWTAGRGARLPLRQAITEYVILNKFTDSKDNSSEHRFSYLEIYPKTGRTHQIRVHLRYLNHPIVSDPLYRGSQKLALGMKRLALHAYSITFYLSNGEPKIVESPLPGDFNKTIKKYILAEKKGVC